MLFQVMFLGFSLKQSEEEVTKQAEVKSLLRGKLRELGSLTWHEAVVTVDFLVLVALWFFRYNFLVLVALWFFRDPDFMVGWAPAISPGGQGYVKVGGTPKPENQNQKTYRTIVIKSSLW